MLKCLVVIVAVFVSFGAFAQTSPSAADVDSAMAVLTQLSAGKKTYDLNDKHYLEDFTIPAIQATDYESCQAPNPYEKDITSQENFQCLRELAKKRSILCGSFFPGLVALALQGRGNSSEAMFYEPCVSKGPSYATVVIAGRLSNFEGYNFGSCHKYDSSEPLETWRKNNKCLDDLAAKKASICGNKPPLFRSYVDSKPQFGQWVTQETSWESCIERAN
jgi:hypothetical protein